MVSTPRVLVWWRNGFRNHPQYANVCFFEGTCLVGFSGKPQKEAEAMFGGSGKKQYDTPSNSVDGRNPFRTTFQKPWNDWIPLPIPTNVLVSAMVSISWCVLDVATIHTMKVIIYVYTLGIGVQLGSQSRKQRLAPFQYPLCDWVTYGTKAILGLKS